MIINREQFDQDIRSFHQPVPLASNLSHFESEREWEQSGSRKVPNGRGLAVRRNDEQILPAWSRSVA